MGGQVTIENHKTGGEGRERVIRLRKNKAQLTTGRPIDRRGEKVRGRTCTHQIEKLRKPLREVRGGPEMTRKISIGQ